MMLRAAYTLTVLAVAATATFLASLLPIHNPATAWAVCVAVGNITALVVLTYLPCFCHRGGHQ